MYLFVCIPFLFFIKLQQIRYMMLMQIQSAQKVRRISNLFNSCQKELKIYFSRIIGLSLLRGAHVPRISKSGEHCAVRTVRYGTPSTEISVIKGYYTYRSTGNGTHSDQPVIRIFLMDCLLPYRTVPVLY